MKRSLALACLLFLSLVRPALAQQPALVGRISDPQGASIAGAEVRLSAEDAGTARQTVTNTEGQYRFDSLTPGLYVLDVTKTGFRRHVSVVTLRSEKATTFDLQLAIAGINQRVVVTATGRVQAIGDASKAVNTVDAQEIRDRNESTLSEVIRYTPGVQILSTGGHGQLAQMRIRGLRSDAAAVLIDGLRFRDASATQGDGSSFFSNLNFISADRVEVLRGSASSLYGTNAVGGAINIVTPQGGGPLKVEGQFEGGSLGFLRARGSLSRGWLNDRLKVSAGVLQLSESEGLDGHDATRSTGVQAFLGYDFTTRTSLIARVFASNDRVDANTSPTASGLPAANIPNTTIVDAIANVTFIPGRDDPDSSRESAFQSTAIAFRHNSTDGVRWQLNYQRVRTGRTYLNGPAGPGFQPSTENYSRYVGDIDTIDARGLFRPVAWIGVTAGYEFERERYRDHQDNNLPAPSLVQTTTDISQQAHAAFASADVEVLQRRLHISLSGRAQTFHLARPDLTFTGTTNPYANVALPAPPAALTADAAIAYFMSGSKTKIRAHVGNAYRAPALYERFGGGFFGNSLTGQVTFTPYGDPRLSPDRYQSLDGGIDQSLFGSRVCASVTAFYTHVTSITGFDFSGAITPATDPYGRSQGYINGSGGFSRGVELGLESQPSSSLWLSGSYTFTDARTDRDISVPGFFDVLSVFRHTGALVATKQWPVARLATSFSLFVGSERLGSFFAAGRTRAYRYPAFAKAAVVVSWVMPGNRAWPLRAYIKVDNLFNATYYENGWRAMGRTALLGASIGF